MQATKQFVTAVQYTRYAFGSMTAVLFAACGCCS
jgi:hypothetical protein